MSNVTTISLEKSKFYVIAEKIEVYKRSGGVKGYRAGKCLYEKGAPFITDDQEYANKMVALYQKHMSKNLAVFNLKEVCVDV